MFYGRDDVYTDDLFARSKDTVCWQAEFVAQHVQNCKDKENEAYQQFENPKESHKITF